MTGRLDRRCGRDDRGIVTVWVASTVASLLLLAGFLLDGIGVVLRARSEAFAVAASAARAGAQALDDDAAVHGQVRVDPDGAMVAATYYLEARGIEGSVAVAGDEVTVTVHEVADLQVLPGSLTITATATVAAIETGRPA
jgi:hypothetical protein